MPENELKELAEDIKKNGLLEDITLTLDGSLLDGNSRWDACELAGIEPRTVVYRGADSISFVISKNKYRKHLEIGQLAMVMAKLAGLKRGYHSDSLAEGISRKALSEQSGLSYGTIDNARMVLNHGAPNVVAMVEKGEVTVRTAAEAVRSASKETQANWTKDDVKKEGRKVFNSYRSTQDRKAVAKKNAVQKQSAPPVLTMKFPSAEETGFPINGTIEQKDAHHKKYGRTPMYPKEVKDMLNNEAWVGAYTTAIISVTNDTHPEAEACCKALDEMSAWVPRPEKGTDWAINFASKAKKHLGFLEQRLPVAIDRLTKLFDALKQRKKLGE